MSAGPAAALLAAAAVTALLADRTASVAVLAIVLLGVCMRAPRGRRWPYILGALSTALMVFLVSPLVQHLGTHIVWTGPDLPVFGQLDVTGEELEIALFQAIRLAAVGLAFSAYALLLDHDRLIQAAGFARRSVLWRRRGHAPRADARAGRTRVSWRRCAGEEWRFSGLWSRARLLSPLVANSLERGLNLAEAMEARGYGRPGRTRTPRPPWTRLDHAASLLRRSSS